MAIVTASVPETTKSMNQKPQTAPMLEVPKAETAIAAESVPVDKKLSPQYAALARREKEIRTRQEALKAKELEWKTKEAEYAKNYVPKERLQKDTLAALFETGLTQDQLVNMILNGQPQVDPALSAMQLELKSIKDAQEAQTKAAAEQQTAAYQRAVSEIRSQAEALVASNDDYATIKETSSTEAIVELITLTYETEGKLLSVDQAAKEVEEHLIQEALKMASLTKVKAKLTPAEIIADEKIDPNKKPSLAEAKAAAPQQTQIKTLTNAATANPSKPLSNRDRRERAIAAFKGQLT